MGRGPEAEQWEKLEERQDGRAVTPSVTTFFLYSHCSCLTQKYVDTIVH